MERTAIIFNVQRFSVHDGPGIRSTVFFKGCPLRCRWCQNPESLKPRPELAFYADRCKAEGACISACPQEALAPEEPRVLWDRCDACGHCVERCPHDALVVIGRSVTVAELVDEVARDKPFYDASGGGVTLSGGEATSQLPFAVELAQACQELGISVGLQTCGAFSWQAFARHLARFAFIHYDLKAMDPSAHKDLTGASNRAVLDNARRLVAADAPVVFRVPVIPTHTDSDDNLTRIAAFLDELQVGEVHLLEYHGMGEVKSGRIGWPLEPLWPTNGNRVDPRDSLRHATALFEQHGIAVHGQR
jgi:pyruvate formate lyase activating enzyme